MSRTIKHAVTHGSLEKLETLRLQHKLDKQQNADFKLQLKNT